MNIFRIEHKYCGFGFFTAYNRMSYDNDKYNEYIASNRNLFIELDSLLYKYPNLPSDEANELGIYVEYKEFLNHGSLFGCCSLEQLKENWINTPLLNLLKQLDFVLVEYKLKSCVNTYITLKTQTVFNPNLSEKINTYTLDIL